MGTTRPCIEIGYSFVLGTHPSRGRARAPANPCPLSILVTSASPTRLGPQLALILGQRRINCHSSPPCVTSIPTSQFSPWFFPGSMYWSYSRSPAVCVLRRALHTRLGHVPTLCRYLTLYWKKFSPVSPSRALQQGIVHYFNPWLAITRSR